MRAERFKERWIVARGRKKVSFFSFFVDGDSSSWTIHRYGAAQFRTKEEVRETIDRLRDWAAIRRQP